MRNSLRKATYKSNFSVYKVIPLKKYYLISTQNKNNWNSVSGYYKYRKITWLIYNSPYEKKCFFKRYIVFQFPLFFPPHINQLSF